MGKLLETVQTTCLRMMLPKKRRKWSICIPILDIVWLFLRAENSAENSTYWQRSLSWFWEMRLLGTGMQRLAVGVEEYKISGWSIDSAGYRLKDQPLPQLSTLVSRLANHISSLALWKMKAKRQSTFPFYL